MVCDEAAPSPDHELLSKTDHQFLRGALINLPARLARIIRLRFGLDGADEHTLEEVGRRLGLTRERIRQLQKEAFHKLRLMMEETSVQAG
jgi:RNA polymerase primary sigma factor